MLGIVKNQHERFALLDIRKQPDCQCLGKIARCTELQAVENAVLQRSRTGGRGQEEYGTLSLPFEFLVQLTTERGLACAAFARDLDDSFVDLQIGQHALQDFPVWTKTQIHAGSSQITW